MKKSFHLCHYLFFSIILLVVFHPFIGCDNFPFDLDPLSGPFRYRFEEIQEMGGGIFTDLNHDGIDEYIEIYNYNDIKPERPSNIYIKDHKQEVISQPYVDKRGIIQYVSIFDWDGNGTDEIAIFYEKNDTLLIKLTNSKGDLLVDEPLIIGESLIVGRDFRDWLGKIRKVEYLDIDNDKNKELIVFPNESWARTPRGVFVFDGRSFKEKNKYLVGPALFIPQIIDLDNDGYKEIFIPTHTANNSNEANGTDDKHSYLFMLNHKLEEKWRKELGGLNSGVIAKIFDLDGDGVVEIVALYYESNDNPAHSRIEIIDPITGNRKKPRLDLPSSFSNWIDLQIDGDIEKEILVTSTNGLIWLINENLQIVDSTKIDTYIGGIFKIDDITGDNLEEVFLHTTDGTIWIDENLNILAKTTLVISKNYDGERQLFHQQGVTPLLALKRDNNIILTSLVKDKYYLIKYYLPHIISLCIFLAIFIPTYMSITSRKKNKFLNRILNESITINNNHILIYLGSNSKLLFLNKAAQDYLELEDIKLPISLKSSKIDNEKKYFYFYPLCQQNILNI